MGRTNAKRAVRRPRTDGVWMATLVCVAMVVALCTPAVASYVKDTGARCGGSDVGYGGHWTNSTAHSTLSPCGNTGSIRHDSGTLGSGFSFYPTLGYEGWYTVAATYPANNYTYTVIHKFMYWDAATNSTLSSPDTVINQSLGDDVSGYNHWNVLNGGAHWFARGQDTANTRVWIQNSRYAYIDGVRFAFVHPSTPNIQSAVPVSGGIDVTLSTVDMPGPNDDGGGNADGYYTIYRSETDGFEVVPGTTVPVYTTTTYAGQAGVGDYPGSLTYHDADVIAGHTYYYKVCAWENRLVRRIGSDAVDLCPGG